MSWRKELQSSTERGYGSRWQKARFSYLKSNPWCVMCEKDGVFEAATVVDHIIAHRGNQRLFWDKSNWQGLCKKHHNSTKQRMEKSGASGCDENGIPNGWDHHWRKG